MKLKLERVFSERKIVRPASPGGPGVGYSCEAYYCRRLGLLVIDLSAYDSSESTPEDELPDSVRKVVNKINTESEALRRTIALADAFCAELINHLKSN